MKKWIIFCLMCISLTHIYAQDLFRYVDGKKHYFEISSNKVILMIDEKMSENANGNRNAIQQLANQWKNNDTILYVGYVIIDEAGRETAALSNQINVRLKEDNDFPILLLLIRYATDDTHYGQQWGLHSNTAGIKAPQAWNISEVYNLKIQAI